MRDLDGNLSGIISRPLFLTCSPERNRDHENYLEIDLVQQVTISFIVIYQVNPKSHYGVYRERLLEGSKILVDSILFGTVSRDQVTKAVMVFNNSLSGSLVKFESGSKNSITLCEIKVWGKKQKGSIIVQPPGLYNKLIGDEINKRFTFQFEENFWYDVESCIKVEVLDPKRRVIQMRECCDGNQSQYRCQMDTTFRNNTCLNWIEAFSTADLKLPAAEQEALGIGNHNFCRNLWKLDNDLQGIGCYVKPNVWQRCPLSYCNCSDDFEFLTCSDNIEDLADDYGDFGYTAFGKPI